jgi:CBS-domain-containing membrane protein
MIPKTKRLLIYLGESDLWHHQPAYMAILEFLRGEGCAGATVTRGIAGFGASSRIKTTAILRLSMDLPVMITVVDRQDRIERVLPRLKEMVGAGLMTLEDVDVVKYTPILKHGLPHVQAGDVMTRAVETVGPDTPVSSVIEILADKDYNVLPVVDANRHVIGMIGDTDLLESGEVSLRLSLPRAGGPDVFEQILARLRRSTTKVRDVMKPPATTIGAETPLGEAAHLMVTRGLKLLPVVGGDGRLEGVLGRLDLLKTMASVHLPHADIAPRAAAAEAPHRIGDVMSRDVPAVGVDAGLDEVIDLVVGSPAKRVVVVDAARRPVGIITDTDLVQRLSPEVSAGFLEIVRSKIPLESVGGDARRHLAKTRGTHAGEVMTAPVITVREDTPFADALTISAEKHVKRFPVVDDAGGLVGIVGRMELLRGFLAATETSGG